MWCVHSSHLIDVGSVGSIHFTILAVAARCRRKAFQHFFAHESTKRGNKTKSGTLYILSDMCTYKIHNIYIICIYIYLYRLNMLPLFVVILSGILADTGIYILSDIASGIVSGIFCHSIHLTSTSVILSCGNMRPDKVQRRHTE